MRTTPAVLLIFLSSLFLVACNSSKNESRYAFDTGNMLANYADNIIIPQYKAFAENTIDLQASVKAYREAVNEGSLSKAQIQWEKTAVNWQQAELYLVGPVAENDFALRQRINVYSEQQKTSACQIDKTTLVLADDAGSVEINALKSNQTGLGALDYLLFNESTDFSCAKASGEQLKKWQKIDIEATRALFAEMVAKDLAIRAESLYQAWQIDGANFRAQFINPANGGEYIQELSNALFYLEKNVKDLKLALPIGRVKLDEKKFYYAYPDLVEYPYSKRSLLMIKANIISFKEAFNGGEGFGFANIIIERGQKSLVDTFNTNIDAVLTLMDKIEKLDVTLYDQASLILQENNEGLTACNNAIANPTVESSLPVCQLYGLVNRITDDLKTGFVAVVDLDIPKRAQSDND